MQHLGITVPPKLDMGLNAIISRPVHISCQCFKLVRFLFWCPAVDLPFPVPAV